jgi:hypothetical protein
MQVVVEAVATLVELVPLVVQAVVEQVFLVAEELLLLEQPTLAVVVVEAVSQEMAVLVDLEL